jgi:hypothetical protein
MRRNSLVRGPMDRPYLDFALAALNQDEQHNDEQNSCNNANNSGCIHAFSYFKVDKAVSEAKLEQLLHTAKDADECRRK